MQDPILFAASGAPLPTHLSSGAVDGRGQLHVQGDAVGRAAGARLTPNSVDILAPVLGQWSLFTAAADIATGHWVITNDVFLAHRVATKWAEKYGLNSAPVRRVPPGTTITARHGPHGWTLTEQEPDNTTPAAEPEISVLDEAITTVEEALLSEVRGAARRARPLALLLSAGVDSGVLADLLMGAGADVTALTIRTPWGDEVDGATRTARHVGIPLVTLDVSAEQVRAGLRRSLLWLQDDDPQTVLIHVLIGIAFDYATHLGRDLVTGMGSDLLNAVSDTGMDRAPSTLAGRVTQVSGCGLMHTNGLGVFGPQRVHHPYWTAAAIPTQLAVSPLLKHRDGLEKYYLRQLAARRLPPETAFGEKFAIHQGSHLEYGLQQELSPDSLADHIRRQWDELLHAPVHYAHL